MDLSRERRRLRDREGQKVCVGFDALHSRIRAVVVEHRPGAATDFEDPSRQIAHELTTDVGISLLVGFRRHQVEKLGAPVVLLEPRDLLAIANEVDDLLDHVALRRDARIGSSMRGR